jgi:hypothetical protein
MLGDVLDDKPERGDLFHLDYYTASFSVFIAYFAEG